MNRNERRESDRLFAPTAEEIAEVEYWRSMIRYGRAPAGWRSSGREARTSGVQGTGAPVASQMIGNLGSFVPNEFFTEFMPRTMRAHDAIFDPDVVTYIKTTHGRPIQVPFISDVENVATVITEGIQDIQIDPAQVISGTIVQAWAYRTPFWGISIEALEDLEESFTAIELFKAFASDRIARAVPIRMGPFWY